LQQYTLYIVHYTLYNVYHVTLPSEDVKKRRDHVTKADSRANQPINRPADVPPREVDRQKPRVDHVDGG